MTNVKLTDREYNKVEKNRNRFLNIETNSMLEDDYKIASRANDIAFGLTFILFANNRSIYERKILDELFGRSLFYSRLNTNQEETP